MKIIIPGKDQSKETHRAQCNGCAGLVEFERDEATLVYIKRKPFLSVSCPTEGCGEAILKMLRDE